MTDPRSKLRAAFQVALLGPPSSEDDSDEHHAKMTAVEDRADKLAARVVEKLGVEAASLQGFRNQLVDAARTGPAAFEERLAAIANALIPGGSDIKPVRTPPES